MYKTEQDCDSQSFERPVKENEIYFPTKDQKKQMADVDPRFLCRGFVLLEGGGLFLQDIAF